jgi:hypothetical protein
MSSKTWFCVLLRKNKLSERETDDSFIMSPDIMSPMVVTMVHKVPPGTRARCMYIGPRCTSLCFMLDKRNSQEMRMPGTVLLQQVNGACHMDGIINTSE